MSGDERDPDERPKLSWREIDQRRDRSRHVSSEERRPRSEAAQGRAKAATQRYLNQLDDTLFGAESAGLPPGEGRLAQSIRAAQGTAGLADACRTYLEEVGVPQDAALLSAFLDSRDREIVLAALEHMERRASQNELDVTTGLRSQLRMLAEETDDDVAERAEQILDHL